ncbi:hypothetical protein [Chryseobacterium vrystaatense]|uniref:Uncharacterized protein n=1 Tax=Chryseobacterium vrystaatense TaxID=307480 RepID=A0A1M4ZKQ6_9FLAO|nr:hypothetical protein [Chryseobacterium vrystaatense]SHF18535.1 hypothetical protein SAMN02787073_1626 [Chryseobacterium vrystaatense]
MELGFVEDFTTDVVLDKELKLNSKTGIILNSGVHPSLTLDNLLQFLPIPEFKIESYNNTQIYNRFSESQDRKDIVSFNGEVYECLVNNLSGEDPEDNMFWLKTNKESLILKSFSQKVKDKVISDLKLSKRLINSQYLYDLSQNELMLSGDYSAFVFESKGSDYIKFTIHEIALQALTTDPISLYILNQGKLIQTITIHPKNGKLEFEKISYSFSGPGKWMFAIDSQRILSNSNWIDSLKYDGFICYTATGTGLDPENCEWSYNSTGNGLGFNISVSLESDKYIEQNLLNFTEHIRNTFELMALQSFLYNSNNRSNRNTNMQMDKELLMYETKELQANTVAKRYHASLKEAKRIINKTFDTQLGDNDGLEIEIVSV